MATDRRRFDRVPAGSRGLDFANIFTKTEVTVANQAHADLDPAGPPFGGTQQVGGPVLQRHGHVLHTLDVFNNTGVDGQVHIGGRFHAITENDLTGATDNDFLWGAGQWDDDDAGDSYADDSADAKNSTVDTFDLTDNQAAPVLNDGFVVHATRHFNCIVIPITTAQVNHANTVHEWTYWNGAAWANLTLISPAVDFATINRDYPIVFEIPPDWSSVAPPEGIPAGRFAIRYRATVAAATTGGIASQVFIGRMRHTRRLVPNGGAIIENQIGFPVSGMDESLWMVVGSAAAGWTVSVGTERNGFVGFLGQQ